MYRMRGSLLSRVLDTLILLFWPSFTSLPFHLNFIQLLKLFSLEDCPLKYAFSSTKWQSLILHLFCVTMLSSHWAGENVESSWHWWPLWIFPSGFLSLFLSLCVAISEVAGLKTSLMNLNEVEASLVAQHIKNSPAMEETEVGSIPGLGRSPREGNGYPLQYLAWRIPRIEEPGRL